MRGMNFVVGLFCKIYRARLANDRDLDLTWILPVSYTHLTLPTIYSV